MAEANCFGKLTSNNFGSDYIARKKAKTIFKGAVNVAKNNGVLHKKNGSEYRGEIFTSTNNGCKKLIGASNYDQLRNVTFGKYIADPNKFTVNHSDDLWAGNLYVEDLSGLVTVDASFGGTPNTFTMDPSADVLYVDPSYELFYKKNQSNSDIRGSCYAKQQLAYKQYVSIATQQSTNNKFAGVNFEQFKKQYVRQSNGLVGDIYYPAAIVLECEDKI